MEVLFVMLPVTALTAAGLLALFAWALWSGQYDDIDAEAIRVLKDRE